MSENTVLEGLALRRAVAEAQGWRMVDVGDGYWLCERDVVTRIGKPGGKLSANIHANSEAEAWEYASRHYFDYFDFDLNTIKDAAAMLPDTHKLEVTLYPVGESIAVVDAIGSIGWSANRIAVSHTEPATAAWNAVLRWKAREQEAESVK